MKNSNCKCEMMQLFVVEREVRAGCLLGQKGRLTYVIIPKETGVAISSKRGPKVAGRGE